MTIILFLIDTSSSMNQRAFIGGRHTLLDVAKGAVETFIKIRQRDPASRGDRYMLLTFEDPPTNIKAGWKENHTVFTNELKNLQATGMSTLGGALKNSFDVLNINRMQTGIDTYGQGRCPFYLEPSVIVVITDGGRLSTTMGVQEDLNLPMHSPIPGSELTKEPFRWDQRLFSLVLRLSGTPSTERDPNTMVPSDTSPIDAMCEVTGGRSYSVSSQRMLLQCLESLVQKVQSGVVINFEKVGADPPPVPAEGRSGDGTPTEDILEIEDGVKVEDDKKDSSGPKFPIGSTSSGATNGIVPRPSSPLSSIAFNNSWQSCRKLIYVHRSAQKGYSVGHWPFPEAFWPDVNTPALPPRTAHPVVKFTCQNNEPMVIDNLPFDKYELEPSPLTQYILSRKQPTTCWQVFVSSSHKNSEVGHPFGYLKASTNLQCVNIFVMPYNYPVLLPLLDDLFKVHRLKPSKEWRQQFDAYLKNMPLYYAGPLKRALLRMGAPSLVPETMENYLSYSVLNYLKKLKNQAKSEFEKLIASVGSVAKPLGPEGIRVIPRTDPRKDLCPLSNPALSEKFSTLKEQIVDFNGFMLGVKDKELRTQSFRNPFDIPRRSLLDHIARMRSNYLQTSIAQTKLQDEDQLHNMPVGQMGNYQEYLKRTPPPLREIETQPVRQHMFGNPFKIDKRMMVDEADIDLVGSASPTRGSKRSSMESPPGSPRPNKRKPGPLPRDVSVMRRAMTPPVLRMTPPLSPGMPPLPPASPMPYDFGRDVMASTTPDVLRSTASFGQLNGDGAPEDLRMPSIDECEMLDSLLEPEDYDMAGEGTTNHIDAMQETIDLISSNHVGVVDSRRGIGDPLSAVLEESACNSFDELEESVSTDNERAYGDGESEEEMSTTLVVPVPVNNGLSNNVNALGVCSTKLDEFVLSENAKLKKMIFKELRKPGRNFQCLFGKLDEVQGSSDARFFFVGEIIREAARFKRKFLIQLLESFQKTLIVQPAPQESPPQAPVPR